MLVETLRPEEKLLGAWPTFGGHIRIATIPLERLGAGEIFERTVIDDVFAEAIWLQVPLQAVNGGVDVTVRAAKCALEGELGGVEEPLAATESVNIPGPAEVHSRDNLLGAGIDDGDTVIQAIRNI